MIPQEFEYSAERICAIAKRLRLVTVGIAVKNCEVSEDISSYFHCGFRCVIEFVTAYRVEAHKHCNCCAASKASQNPMKGPNENAKYTRSPPPTPAERKTSFQFSSIQLQPSSVSSQRNGALDVPLVWWKRVYRSSG